jgi:hypothetical protein
VPLYTRCLKCGGWRQMPEDPTQQDQVATGMMLNVPEPPRNLCSCDDDSQDKASE